MIHKLLLLSFISLLLIPIISRAEILRYEQIKINVLGIKNSDLAKIPIGITNFNFKDSDKDGLDNEFEKAIGTNPASFDSDNDGYADKTEILTGNNPLGKKIIESDLLLAKKVAGKYLLQTENFGILWYVNPTDLKRYLVGDKLRYELLVKKIQPLATTTIAKLNPLDANKILELVATNIRAKKIDTAVSFFTTDIRSSVKYSLEHLDNDGLFIFANILSGAKLQTDGNQEKIYYSDVYFSLGNKSSKVNITITKQADGTWLISKI